MSRETPQPPEECAQCGAVIPRRAHACPGCGADERTGWRETSLYDGLDLPEEAFDDDASATAGSSTPRGVAGLAWYWWVVGIVLLFGFGFGVLGLLR
ncbi:MAG TPA: zinc ribbon domain-containing protein [Rariglobus sp.]|jgi:hypothetical protein|nr:zinc ribbon domain-containing protein [Rariglobus sp.]